MHTPLRFFIFLSLLGLVACNSGKAPAESTADNAPQELAAAAQELEAEPAATDDNADEAAAGEAAEGAAPVILPGNWRVISESELSEAETARLAEARAARGQVAGRLVSSLQAAIEEGGLPHAVDFCNESAPGLHSEGVPEGIRLGRSSHRLRNASNTPPAWALTQVLSGQGGPLLVRGLEGELGELVPIVTGPLCTRCHGAEESFEPELREVLAQRYPADRAVNFAEGDLRGWFWLEAQPN